MVKDCNRLYNSDKQDKANKGTFLSEFLQHLKNKKQNGAVFKTFVFTYLIVFFAFIGKEIFEEKTYFLGAIISYTYLFIFCLKYRTKLIFTVNPNNKYTIFPKEFEKIFLSFLGIILIGTFISDYNSHQIEAVNTNLMLLCGMCLIITVIASNVYAMYQYYVFYFQKHSPNLFAISFCAIIFPLFMTDAYFRILSPQSDFIFFIAYIVLFFSFYMVFSFGCYLWIALLKFISLKGGVK